MTQSEQSKLPADPCRQCDYPGAPMPIFYHSRYFTAHAYECRRCRYSTETKSSWDQAAAAWINGPFLKHTVIIAKKQKKSDAKPFDRLTAGLTRKLKHWKNGEFGGT